MKIKSLIYKLVRHSRCYNANIDLLNVYVTSENSIVCNIINYSSKMRPVQYHTGLQIHKEKIKFQCDCMDFIMRGEYCKHIYWICYKKMEYILPNQCTIDDYEKFVRRYKHKYIVGRNENCPICLEKIIYDMEDTICCIQNCQNSVHRFCWILYSTSQYFLYRPNCVFCRNQIEG